MLGAPSLKSAYVTSYFLKVTNTTLYIYIYAKQKQPSYKKMRGQSEATMVISNQKF